LKAGIPQVFSIISGSMEKVDICLPGYHDLPPEAYFRVGRNREIKAKAVGSNNTGEDGKEEAQEEKIEGDAEPCYLNLTQKLK